MNLPMKLASIHWRRKIRGRVSDVVFLDIEADSSDLQRDDIEIENGIVRVQTPFSNIAGVGDGDDQLMLARANDDTSSEEDGTDRGFEMVRIGMSKLQRHSGHQLAETQLLEVLKTAQKKTTPESPMKRKKRGWKNEVSSSMEEEKEEHAKEINS